MSTRTSLFALAAIAALGTTTLAPTSASALGFGGHFGGHVSGHFGVHYWGHGYSYNHWWHPYPWHFCHFGLYCHPHIGIGLGVASTVVTGSVAASAPASVPAPGGCLSKRELPDGSALFRDHCTGEEAESQMQGGGASR
jgi:hypothetical protein